MISTRAESGRQGDQGRSWRLQRTAVARTIADLAAPDHIEADQISEDIQYRTAARNLRA